MTPKVGVGVCVIDNNNVRVMYVRIQSGIAGVHRPLSEHVTLCNSAAPDANS